VSIETIAAENLAELKTNPNPGRVVAVGRPSGDPANFLMLTAIMGRSENSRNRVYGVDGGRVFTEAADPSKVKDPRLIIYNAMDELPCADIFVASNGDQTDTVINFMEREFSFFSALNSRQYEPDFPNYTPRITVVCEVDASIQIWFASLLKSPWDESCERNYFTFEDIPIGYGYYLRTYEGDGDPLPSFRRSPLLLPFTGSPNEVMETIWGALNPANRVALAGKLINTTLCRSTVLPPINRFEKVSK